MDAEIFMDLMNCSLTEEEKAAVVLSEADLTDGVVECEASVYAKIYALRLGFVSIQGFSLAMHELGNAKRAEDPVNGGFEECKFWIQGRGLKEEYFIRDVAGKLIHAFVGCEVIELRRDKGGKKFFPESHGESQSTNTASGDSSPGFLSGFGPGVNGDFNAKISNLQHKLVIKEGSNNGKAPPLEITKIGDKEKETFQKVVPCALTEEFKPSHPSFNAKKEGLDLNSHINSKSGFMETLKFFLSFKILYPLIPIM
ncbi:hypothetical protein LIER_41080 [Lithospermum erythrorhizon]|uniref:Uncharacterized protein n=1 Tax=Lithospermum erythrorhizon TaxID=34254 RepID=A0AAV3R7K7_LITER